ncbi:hypothetical protein SAMN04488082_1195 [Desulfomicrobium apsheronum]|uniref:Lipoprotein n=1 Tax=Desulfomicrobium apsheronum TaxID=52560 RepID=A0A1I3Y6P1_9BACT|nr:hypothetical protein [Desulfomicrobium apsheronum]SFK27443.1 hypothetical protein SAMN04488082_1195 [Desulfomicrobium apsheronum]
MKKLALICMLFVVTGCAVGNKYDYHTRTISLPVKSEMHKKIIFDVEDLRPYVQSEKKKPNFVGLQRGGFGNPFDVTTASGNPLAMDMKESVTRALNDSGYDVVSVNKEFDKKSLGDIALQNNVARVIILTINEWKSDVYMNITLYCDLVLSIYNDSGSLLIKNDMKFEEAIGGAQISASKNSDTVSSEFGRRIGYLFNKKEVRDALSF